MLNWLERGVSRTVVLPSLRKGSRSFEEIAHYPGSPFSTFKREDYAGVKHFVKIGTPRHISRELQGHALMSPRFPSPKVLSASHCNIVYEHIDGRSLFELALESDARAVESYKDFVSHVGLVWSESITEARNARMFYRHSPLTSKTLTSIAKRLSRGKIEIGWNSPLLINGREYPSLSHTFTLALESVRDPEFAVLDPGDANGHNLLVDQEAKWVLVDFEKAGWYDPAYILGRQSGQWRLSVKQEFVTGDIRTVGNVCQIDYESSRPVVADSLIREVMKLTKLLGSVQDFDWRQRVAYYQLVFLSRMATISSSRFYRLVTKSNLATLLLAEATIGFYSVLED